MTELDDAIDEMEDAYIEFDLLRAKYRYTGGDGYPKYGDYSGDAEAVAARRRFTAADDRVRQLRGWRS